MLRVSFSCESLKVTSRLMHVIAWLLTQRAVHNGELRWSDLANPRHHLGEAAASDTEVVGRFPFAARALISASEDLYARVARLPSAMGMTGIARPARPPVPRACCSVGWKAAFNPDAGLVRSFQLPLRHPT